MQGFMQLMQMLSAAQGNNLDKLLGHLNAPPQSRIASAVPGEIRGQGLGNPQTTGLAGFYANNPHMRAGEFDPTGGRANARRLQGYARQDQQAALDFRNQFAEGLLRLFETQQKLPKTKIGADGGESQLGNPGNLGPRQHPVFGGYNFG